MKGCDWLKGGWCAPGSLDSRIRRTGFMMHTRRKHTLMLCSIITRTRPPILWPMGFELLAIDVQRLTHLESWWWWCGIPNSWLDLDSHSPYIDRHDGHHHHLSKLNPFPLRVKMMIQTMTRSLKSSPARRILQLLEPVIKCWIIHMSSSFRLYVVLFFQEWFYPWPLPIQS